MQTPLVFVGIDVSKARLDVGIRPSDERASVPYDAHGITTLLAQLTQVQPTRIVMEATGGLERLLLRALVDAALPVTVVNPRQVPDCAKATGQLANTDTLNADLDDLIQQSPVLARTGRAVAECAWHWVGDEPHGVG